MVLFLISIFTPLALAATPPGLGNYAGVLFTGAALVQPISIEGGSFTDCKDVQKRESTVTTCAVSGASVKVDGVADGFNFTKVAILSSHEGAMQNYYLSGTRQLNIGGHSVSQPVNLTVTKSAKTETRITGYLQLNESRTRSSFEAYAN